MKLTVDKTIVVLVEYFPPRLGADRRIFEIMSRLKNKYQIIFVSIPPAYTLFLKELDKKNLPNLRLTYKGIVGYNIGLPRFILKLWSRTFFLSYFMTMSYLFLVLLLTLIKFKADLVVIKDTSVYAGLIGTLCSRILRKVSIVDFDDLKSTYTAEIVKRKVKIGFPLIQKFLVVIEDFIIRYNWKVTALSSFLVNYAKKRGVREDLILIPDGVDTSLFNPSKINGKKIRKKLGIPTNTRLIVYTGRIDENIGGKILLDTFRLMENENNIKFLVIGEGDPLLTKELTKLTNIYLIDRVPIEKIPEYLASSDVIIVPYPNKPASHAASPLKLFEGIAMNKPIVASEVSGIKEIVNPNFDVTLVPCNPYDFATTLLQKIRQNRRTIIQNEKSRKIIYDRYDWSNLAEKFNDVIKKFF